MPTSQRQLRWAHTAAGTKALGPARVALWDQEAKGVKLPKQAGKGRKFSEPAKWRGKSGEDSRQANIER